MTGAANLCIFPVVYPARLIWERGAGVYYSHYSKIDIGKYHKYIINASARRMQPVLQTLKRVFQAPGFLALCS
jgi:hypothetical protein